jgi:hypothetical protein
MNTTIRENPYRFSVKIQDESGNWRLEVPNQTLRMAKERARVLAGLTKFYPWCEAEPKIAAVFEGSTKIWEPTHHVASN